MKVELQRHLLESETGHDFYEITFKYNAPNFLTKDEYKEIDEVVEEMLYNFMVNKQQD
jgi:hypothetical protein